MKRISTLTLIAALGLTPLAAVAQEQGAGQGAGPMMAGGWPDFATLDADGSGGVTLAEVETAMSARAAAADTDGDGMLSADELVAAMQAMMETRMAAMEAAGTTSARAERMTERMAERMADRMPEMADRMVAMMDRDGDGALSVAEMRPPNLAEMVARIDSDDNGEVSAWEMTQMQAHRMGGYGQRGDRNGYDGDWHGRDWDRDGDREGRDDDRRHDHGGWFNWGRGSN